MSTHRLLQRQLQKHFSEGEKPPALNAFLQAVNEAYIQSDLDRSMLERSIDLTAHELMDANRELVKNNGRISLLYKVLSALQASPDTESTYRFIAHEVRSVTGTDAVELLSLDESGRVVTRITGAGMPINSETEGSPLSAEGSLAGKALQCGQTIEAAITGRGNQALAHALCTPILNGNQPLGAIILANKNNIPDKRETRELIESLAASIATWIRQRQTESLVRDQQIQISTSAKMSSLGQMAGGIAHEIHNPIAVITSLTQEMMDLMSPSASPDPASLKDLLRRVSLTANRVTSIVSGLRTFSRDDSRDPFQPVNLSRLFEETALLCGEKFKQHGVKLFAEDIPADLAVECRATQISQVLLNLMNNALDAVDGRPQAWVRFSVVERTDRITLQVTDSGRGIPAEIADKIFHPFFTTKDIGKGTGLGLSISMGIAKAHDGSLYLDRQSEHTRFCLDLPKKPDPI